VTFGFLVGLVVVICVSLIGIAYGFGGIDWVKSMLNPSATPTPVEEVSEVEEPQDPTLTPTASSAETFVEETATLEPTQAENTPTSTPTETPTPTVTSSPEPVVSFIDDFTGDLGMWDVWDNRLILPDMVPPQIIAGEYLNISGLDSDKVGVTTIQRITLSSEMTIEFEAEVDNFPNHFLYLDWYPGEEVRPENQLGPFYLVISNTEVVFHFRSDGNDEECPVTMLDASMKLYRIDFSPGWEVNLFIDDELQDECSFAIDEPENLEGRITFSGWGLVDSIIITASGP
jgi:hypothetical protein